MGPLPDKSDILLSIKMLVNSVVQTVFFPQQQFICANTSSGTPSTHPLPLVLPNSPEFCIPIPRRPDSSPGDRATAVCFTAI